MNICEQIDRYLYGSLGSTARAQFEDHLGSCDSCRTAVDSWRQVEKKLGRESDERSLFSLPTKEDARRLVDRAALERESGSPRRRYGLGVAAAAAVVCCVLAGIALYTSPDISSLSSLLKSPSDLRDRAATGSVLYETTADGRTVESLGRDRFSLGPASRIRVVENSEGATRVNLDFGSVSFSVAPRDDRGRFVVEVDRFRVAVVGTLFSVRREQANALEVTVAQGAVEVTSPDGTVRRVQAGESLFVSRGSKANIERADISVLERLALLFEDPGDNETTSRAQPVRPEEVNNIERATTNEARTVSKRNGAPIHDDEPTAVELDPPAATEPASPISPIAKWREWIIAGELEWTETAIEEHLGKHPGDAGAWSLLADCRRKLGKWGEAVEAYNKITSVAHGSEADHARFMVGVLLQDKLGDHKRAAVAFEDYLSREKGSSILRAKATVRLARALIAGNDTERASAMLWEIVAQYPGTAAAIEARRLLREMGDRE